MNQENKITLNNLLYSLLFLIFGIILLNRTDDLVSITSKIVGSVLILVGVVKSIIYIYMKGKIGEYSILKLIVGLLLMCFGLLFILFSSALSFVIRTVIGAWILFAGINRIIFAISTFSIDRRGFLVYMSTAILMLILGVILISGIFDQIVGILIIIYSVTELVDYIYYKVKYKNYEQPYTSIEISKKSKKNKKSKKGKIIDAVIDENE